MNTKRMPVKYQWENLIICIASYISVANPPNDPPLYITGPEGQLDITVSLTVCKL